MCTIYMLKYVSAHRFEIATSISIDCYFKFMLLPFLLNVAALVCKAMIHTARYIFFHRIVLKFVIVLQVLNQLDMISLPSEAPSLSLTLILVVSVTSYLELIKPH